MLFNSFSFGIFFLLFVPLYFALPFNLRRYFLLFASGGFYMVLVPQYILILLALILFDYSAGIWIEQAASARTKRMVLVGSIIANMGTLAIFKYCKFFVSAVNPMLTHFGVALPGESLSWVLPLGLSFHTFQSLSYTIEIYRGQRAERNLLTYSLYVLFWPQLVAGPIERPQSLLPQLRREIFFSAAEAFAGFRQILLGLIKKVLIADRLGRFVGVIFDNPEKFEGWPVVAATLFFSIQIYCDFSGYTDIALGTARILGIRLVKNFDAPYTASSLSEFWRRWHISLSSWFRDYVYIPLGGSRKSLPRHLTNMLITFLLSGFWHGANWTFLAWGLFHGFFLSLEVITKPWCNRITVKVPRVFRVAGTFLIVSFGWIFFRANSLHDAGYFISHLFPLGPVSRLSQIHEMVGFKRFGALIACAALAYLMQIWERIERPEFAFRTWPIWCRYSLYYSAITSLFLWGMTEPLKFIYFQF